jgi:hypothetical protein
MRSFWLVSTRCSSIKKQVLLDAADGYLPRVLSLYYSNYWTWTACSVFSTMSIQPSEVRKDCHQSEEIELTIIFAN